MKYTISVLVENRAGVLSKITGLFSRRAFNIDSLAVGTTEDRTMSRITMVVDDNKNSTVEQVEKQLNKLVEVIKVRAYTQEELISKELMIVKVSANQRTRSDIMNVCEIMGAKISDLSATTMTLELADTPDRVDLFADLLRPFSIIELVRTGMIALQKGSGVISAKGNGKQQ